MLRELVGPKFEVVEDALLRTSSFQQQVEIAESALLGLLEHNRFDEDPRYLDAVDRIYRSKGTIDVRTLAGAEETSERHLRRLFDEALGLSPKKLARVVRFQVALNHLRRRNIGSLLELALDLGYYDQSHFINDFRELYGTTPSAHMGVLAPSAPMGVLAPSAHTGVPGDPGPGSRSPGHANRLPEALVSGFSKTEPPVER